MKQAYPISRGTEEFAAAREQFGVIVARLQSALVLRMEHGGSGRTDLAGRHGAPEAVAARAPRCAYGGGDTRGGV